MLSRLLSIPAPELLDQARHLRDLGHGPRVSYSRKVFIPLTRLCRDVCSYCTFARGPLAESNSFLTADEVLAIARAGEAAGCREALFTLGDKPELRYRAARDELTRLGHPTTISYLREMCELVLKKTNLLPHVNPGVMRPAEIASLRTVSVSQGMMLESSAERLCSRGGPHFGSPDKTPAVRLATIEAAGIARVPFTSGILIGIGETRLERLHSLDALLNLHRRYGHLQEIIIQSFRAKPNTRMASAAEPDWDELMWTIAAARNLFGPQMNIQAPPNLSGSGFGELLNAGLNDWGGVSPVTPDHVNPEAPWPQLDILNRETQRQGGVLVERLAVYPAYAMRPDEWQDEKLIAQVLSASDATGYSRTDFWIAGQAGVPQQSTRTSRLKVDDPTRTVLHDVASGARLSEAQIEHLFVARDLEFETICAFADELRRATVGDTVRYVVNRNINYTNVCSFKCTFCAFSKGRGHESLRGPAYDLELEEVTRRVVEAVQRGATEVCMQGGIHPAYTGETYLQLCRAVRRASPDVHIHAFSPLEVTHGARTLGITITEFLRLLKAEGLGTLPGTAAEILDDAVREKLCPDKLDTDGWLDVVQTAHGEGIKTTSTVMFGHIDQPSSWARHLLRLRDLQERTGGITEFVPLPFIHMEAPLFRRGRARRGPTFREAVLMHAIARIALHPVVPNIQVSWVKMGREGAAQCLRAGANDLGGTLMNESISRAAGTQHGQECGPAEMDSLILRAGRLPQQRTTLYGAVSSQQTRRSYEAGALSPVVLSPLKAERLSREMRRCRVGQAV